MNREQPLKKTRETLNANGYHCVATHILRETDGKTKCGELRIYVGNGEVLILNAQFIPQEGIVGFDLFAPVTTDNSVDSVLEAIRARSKVAA